MANKKIMDLCDTASGKNLSEVSEKSSEFGLSISYVEDGETILIHSTRNFGKGVCIIKYEDKIVKSATYGLD